jgi:hypothetical protein
LSASWTLKPSWNSCSSLISTEATVRSVCRRCAVVQPLAATAASTAIIVHRMGCSFEEKGNAGVFHTSWRTVAPRFLLSGAAASIPRTSSFFDRS